MTDIYSLTYEQAEKLLTENGFRATQCANIFRDIYKRKATGFNEMTLCLLYTSDAADEL